MRRMFCDGATGLSATLRDAERAIAFWARNVHKIYGASTSVFARLERIPSDKIVLYGSQEFQMPKEQSYQFVMSDFRADILDVDILLQRLTKQERTALFCDAVNEDGYSEEADSQPEPRERAAEMAGMSIEVFVALVATGKRKIMGMLTAISEKGDSIATRRSGRKRKS